MLYITKKESEVPCEQIIDNLFWKSYLNWALMNVQRLLSSKEEKPFHILGVSCATRSRKKHSVFKETFFSSLHLVIDIHLFLISIYHKKFHALLLQIELFLICNTCHSYIFTLIYMIVVIKNCFICYILISIMVRTRSILIHHHISSI